MYSLLDIFLAFLGIPVVLAFFIGLWVPHTKWMIVLWLSVSWWWLVFLFGRGNGPTDAHQLFAWVMGCLISAAITAVPLAIGRWMRSARRSG